MPVGARAVHGGGAGLPVVGPSVEILCRDCGFVDVDYLVGTDAEIDELVKLVPATWLNSLHAHLDRRRHRAGPALLGYLATQDNGTWVPRVQAAAHCAISESSLSSLVEQLRDWGATRLGIDGPPLIEWASESGWRPGGHANGNPLRLSSQAAYHLCR
jgi:hypothetical protein